MDIKEQKRLDKFTNTIREKSGIDDISVIEIKNGKRSIANVTLKHTNGNIFSTSYTSFRKYTKAVQYFCENGKEESFEDKLSSEFKELYPNLEITNIETKVKEGKKKTKQHTVTFTHIETSISKTFSLGYARGKGARFLKIINDTGTHCITTPEGVLELSKKTVPNFIKPDCNIKTIAHYKVPEDQLEAYREEKREEKEGSAKKPTDWVTHFFDLHQEETFHLLKSNLNTYVGKFMINKYMPELQDIYEENTSSKYLSSYLTYHGYMVDEYEDYLKQIEIQKYIMKEYGSSTEIISDVFVKDGLTEEEIEEDFIDDKKRNRWAYTVTFRNNRIGTRTVKYTNADLAFWKYGIAEGYFSKTHRNHMTRGEHGTYISAKYRLHVCDNHSGHLKNKAGYSYPCQMKNKKFFKINKYMKNGILKPKYRGNFKIMRELDRLFRGLDCDHIDGNPNNCNLSNIQILCKMCHSVKTNVNGDHTSTGRGKKKSPGKLVVDVDFTQRRIQMGLEKPMFKFSNISYS